MQANWSLILNVLLLIGVVFGIIQMLKVRRKPTRTAARSPSIGQFERQHAPAEDDIISVRKIHVQDNPRSDKPVILAEERFSQPVQDEIQPQQAKPVIHKEKVAPEPTQIDPTSPLVMFLLAKENRHMAGYELLQSVLAAGLRFGDGNLFHRHQHANGQGPVMCSLAAATDTGVFDLQNIGAFVVRGLCLFMHASGNASIDQERFDIMLDTATTLSDHLDAFLLDDQRQTLSESSIQRYHEALGIMELAEA